jgi:hypothetical protein
VIKGTVAEKDIQKRQGRSLPFFVLPYHTRTSNLCMVAIRIILNAIKYILDILLPGNPDGLTRL